MAIIKKYSSEVVSFDTHGDEMYSVSLRSLSGKYKFSPGQFLHFSLDEYDPSMGWPESRCFSIQNSHNEELIKITFSIKGSYTNRMSKELKIGKFVSLKLPYGDLFSKTHSKEDTVFISGGTGITPFLSLFTDATFADYRNPILFAGFRNSSLNIYNKELANAKQINPSFTINILIQQEHGILDKQKILEHSKKNCSFFISGPQNMIFTFKEYFLENGIIQNQINTDDWE